VNSFELSIWYDEGRRCTFYTVLKENADENETDAFFTRFEEVSSPYHDDALALLQLIVAVIGDKYGALDDFFNRPEDKAQALPPKPNKFIPEVVALGIQFPLRLYCFRVSESIVVLFNGGIKSAASVLDSDDLRFKFLEAQNFAQRIAQEMAEGMIQIDKVNNRLTDFKGNHEIFL